MDESKEKLDWEYRSAQIRFDTNNLLADHFGKRCADYCSTCPICKRYDQLDRLLENPYDQETRH